MPYKSFIAYILIVCMSNEHIKEIVQLVADNTIIDILS